MLDEYLKRAASKDPQSDGAQGNPAIGAGGY
jgi:hypothetical protein